jgi:hypothetical protein
MKKSTLLLIALLLCTGGIFAQKTKSTKSSLSTSISDDDNELSIHVKGTINGKYVNFDRTYNVADLSEKEKNKLIRSVGDSLGVNLNHAPLAPMTPPLAALPPSPPTPPLPPLPPLESHGIGVYSERVKSGFKPKFDKSLAEIRIICDVCPQKATFSLTSEDKNSIVTFNFREEDKDVFPLVFKAKDGRYTFKYEYGKTSFSETLTLKKNDVIIKKL